jgi:diguanylate cyclase (GGDEF)-like protein
MKRIIFEFHQKKMKPDFLRAIYKNDEERRIASVLLKIIFGLFTAYIVLIGMAFYWGDPTLVIISLVGGIMLAIPIILLLGGHLHESSLLFILIVVLTVTIIAIQGQGIHDIAIITYPVAIVFSSLLMKRRDFFWISFLILIAMGSLVFGEAYGLFISKTYEKPTAPDFIIVVVVLLIAILTVDTLAENTRRNILLAQKEIERRKKIEAQLRHLVIHDELTGIYNRAFFDEELALMERSREYPMSIIVADIDDLKVVNDKLGHAIGDKLLKNTAKALSTAFRAGDVLARIGGDEFAVLLPHTDSSMAGQLLFRLRAALAQYNNKNPDLPIQISFGASTAEKGELKEAFIIADQSMYTDKATRKQK